MRTCLNPPHNPKHLNMFLNTFRPPRVHKLRIGNAWRKTFRN